MWDLDLILICTYIYLYKIDRSICPIYPSMYQCINPSIYLWINRSMNSTGEVRFIHRLIWVNSIYPSYLCIYCIYMPLSMIMVNEWIFHVCVYIYIYIYYVISIPYQWSYIYIGRTCLVAPMLLLIRMRSVCIQLNTNVIRGACETCTTCVTRAQLLWNVHNISETCTYRRLENTGWGRWNTLYPHIYILLYIICKR